MSSKTVGAYSETSSTGHSASTRQSSGGSLASLNRGWKRSRRWEPVQAYGLRPPCDNALLYLDAQIGRILHRLPAVICGAIVNICSSI